MSIFSNALDAFEELAETQSANTRAVRLKHIKVRTQVKDGQFVQIRIADNGPGIPESVWKRLFDPFFTTKSVGTGTGMGLAISYQIMVEHKGNLSCMSTPGQGTEFVIEIPVHQVPLPQQYSFWRPMFPFLSALLSAQFLNLLARALQPFHSRVS